ncbi:MAG: hypothetical protein NVS1B11_17670 [Terriglobales bacterium]
MPINEGMQALAVPGRNFEGALVRDEDYDLSQRVVQDRTPMACLQVRLNLSAKNRIDLMTDEIGQLP